MTESDPYREPPSRGSDAIVSVICLECDESWSSSARDAGDEREEYQCPYCESQHTTTAANE